MRDYTKEADAEVANSDIGMWLRDEIHILQRLQRETKNKLFAYEDCRCQLNAFAKIRMAREAKETREIDEPPGEPSSETMCLNYAHGGPTDAPAGKGYMCHVCVEKPLSKILSRACYTPKETTND